MVALVIIALVLLGGWDGLAISATLTICGIFALTRYVQRVAWTRNSPKHLRRGLAGMNDDLALTDDAHDQLSPHDVPLDSPEHRELLYRLHQDDRDRSQKDVGCGARTTETSAFSKTRPERS